MSLILHTDVSSETANLFKEAMNNLREKGISPFEIIHKIYSNKTGEFTNPSQEVENKSILVDDNSYNLS